MDIHLSEEAARFIQAQLAGSGCSSPTEFVERLLRTAAMPAAGQNAWLLGQESVAAEIWDNAADARYDEL